MIELLLIIVIELLILYFLSQKLTQILYSILFAVFKNKHTVYGIITFIYLPGTAVHELAHLIIAEILRVPTGELSFTPKFEKNVSGQEKLKAGSLKIGNSDPLRRYLIGFAPVFIGLMVLCLLIWLFQYFWPQMADLKSQMILIVITGYLIFAISNNMFSSKKDLEGFLIFLPVMVLVISAAYFAGIRINLTDQALSVTNRLLTGLSQALGIVIGINIVVLLINIIVLKSLNKLNSLFKF